LSAKIARLHPTTFSPPLQLPTADYGCTRLVIHLVNYNFDQKIDTFTPSGPFTLTVNTEGLNLSSAKIYDFESGSVNEIQILAQEDRVTLSIPDLQTYTILELKP